MQGSGSLVLVLLAGLSSAVMSTAKAAPLDKASCTELKDESKKMLDPSMKAALDQGPDWVKAHLDDGSIERVRQYLSIEEKIEFQCRGGGAAKKPIKTGARSVPLPLHKPAGKVVKASAKGHGKTSQAMLDQDKTASQKVKATR